MTIRPSHRLDGLEPDNLLAFLALLGLLRSLNVHDGLAAENERVYARAAWDIDVPPLRPRLFVSGTMTTEQIVAASDRGLQALASSYDFGGRQALDYLGNECRAVLALTAKEARAAARGRADLMAALMCDGAIKGDKDPSVAPTPLCLLQGSGRQYFLERLQVVTNQLAAEKDRRGRNVTGKTGAECIAGVLFEPWRRFDYLTSSFRWDPAEDVRQALIAGDPTDPAYKPGTEHGANRLAAIGLASLTLVPQVRAGRVRPNIIGGASTADGFSFAWPIWREPATLSGIRALLSHPELRKPGGLDHLGVDHVLVARRISVGKFMNFSRARAIA